MAQKAPAPSTVKEAVGTVIAQNKSVGYNPARFIQITQGGYANDLIEICDRLIQRGETLDAVSNQLGNYPDILTLEDLIVHSPHGKEWGLDESTIEIAKARVETWDIEVGHQRWCQQPNEAPR